MIFDKTLLFSDEQAIIATAASTNTISTMPQGKYLGATSVFPRDQGKGNKVPLLIQVTQTFTSAGADNTLTINLQLDSTDTITPDASISLGTFPKAQLVAGFQIPFDYIPKGTNLEFMRLNYVVGGTGNFSAGKITAGVVAAVQEN